MNFEDIKLPPNKKFGYFFTGIFFFCSFYFFITGQNYLLYIMSFLMILTLIVSLTKPSLLLPFNRTWMYIGFLIGKVVSPIVLGIIFFGIITPTAILMKLFERDELLLKIKNKKSHWKKRVPIGPEPESFNHQF